MEWHGKHSVDIGAVRQLHIPAPTAAVEWHSLTWLKYLFAYFGAFFPSLKHHASIELGHYLFFFYFCVLTAYLEKSFLRLGIYAKSDNSNSYILS